MSRRYAGTAHQTQKKLYFLSKITWKTRCYNYTLGLFTFFAVIIVPQLPACIPLYWISVSFSGFVQTQFLRHPTVKRFLGIKRLPTDSQTPIRDLFLSKRV
ncbi:hypothetical protein DICVIV_08174 [Dictyocaulus viviparus]|uniref:Uncharacterized protein n=1 Tax=Dictyocaulus viviparus TaxID=29172 RepID=A0A0D8XMD1_DICVI|nr:hypothetical protein DICVIV_08174 [Dictyocaulus viviparus]